MAERRVHSTVRAGDVVYARPSASPQFSAGKGGLRFRVIRTHEWNTSWEGWAWLDGYRLNAAGDAVERRSTYVDLMDLPAAALPPKRQR